MPAWLDRWLRPREGWLSLALLFVMLLALGWSVQKAAWLRDLEFLIPVAFYAVVLGAILGLTRLSVVFTLPIGAIAGAGIVLWSVGGEYFTDASQLGRLFAMRGEAITWLHILIDRGFPPQQIPYAVGLGLVMWVTSFIAAYTIYRHHRVLDAILLVGAALIANMSATYTDLFGYLVLFMLAGLLLWLRASLTTREEGWVRRRVTENAEVPAAIMRSGVLFIAGSIALAWILTTVAVAAPLTGLWNNLDGAWTNVRSNFEGIFGGLSNGDARIGGTTFGDSFLVKGRWIASDEPVMTIAADRGYYMRTKTYDIYTGHGWDTTPTTSRRVEAGDPFFPGDSPEKPTYEDSFELVTVGVAVTGSVGGNVFAPGFPRSPLAPMIIQEPGGQPFVAGIQAAGGLSQGQGYYVTSLVSSATEAELTAAGDQYPDSVTAMYLGTEGVSEQTRQLAQQVADAAGAETPYAKAKALANFLQRDSRFSYAIQAPLPAADQDLVDFFLFAENGRTGYCEYFATTMAVMARTLGLPARIATGYAPGTRVADGVYEVRAKNAHAWAEVYFPGYGWQIFEATKTIPTLVRSAGEPAPDASGGPRASVPPRFEEGDIGLLGGPIPSFNPVAGGYTPGETAPPPGTQGGNALIVLALLLLALGVAGWRLLRSRRSWRFLAPGERQWRRLALAAGRAGAMQRPNETIYEYAGWLEEQIPNRRPEIRTVADGKVWQTYSGRGMSSDLISRIEAAWKRLQLPLTWLAVRRRLRALWPRRR